MIENIIYSILFFFSAILYGYTSGGLHSIIMIRTHLAKHPYRDVWHLLNWGIIISLVLCGYYLYPLIKSINFYYLFILVIFSCICSYFLREYEIKQTEYWFQLDENIHLSTGIRWLDLFLGFHW